MTHWIEQLVAQLGYLGIALLMLAETVFPPIPSEAIMPLAGMQAARGTLSLPVTILAGTTGAMTGNVMWYLLARRIGTERMRGFVERNARWLTIEWPQIERAGRATIVRGI